MEARVPITKKALRLFRGSRGSKSLPQDGNTKTVKTVRFQLETVDVCSYTADHEQRVQFMYPEETERQILMRLRKQRMTNCMPGSADFKAAIEAVYAGARAKYDEGALSSGEFNLVSVHDDKERIRAMAASEIRGLEELYCSVIREHRTWAIRRVVKSQHDKTLRKKLAAIAGSASLRSKNFARLVGLGDAEEAQSVYKTMGRKASWF